MPVQVGIWRIDSEFKPLLTAPIGDEDRLEGILDQDISIASPHWMVIGRQVQTAHGSRVDLLAIDRDGSLIVIELKRDRTPREVVAQVLDYGSWVRGLKNEQITQIYGDYRTRYKPKAPESFDDAFRQRFNMSGIPEVLNESHELVVVASSLDESTERIVAYLADEYGVKVNVIFFQVFKEDSREYLTRTWFIDPTMAPSATGEPAHEKEPWNGEYYVSFGHDQRRNWDDAVKYGFVSAGGGSWYSKTLSMLEPEGRIWVNIPGQGYTGVGLVTGPVVRSDQFLVKSSDGTEKPIERLPVKASDMFKDRNDPETAEYLVPVKWLKTFPLERAIRETGFFGNQNTVCKPTTSKWPSTVNRLKKHFELQ